MTATDDSPISAPAACYQLHECATWLHCLHTSRPAIERDPVTPTHTCDGRGEGNAVGWQQGTRRNRDAHSVVAEGPNQVLTDLGKCCPAQLQCLHHLASQHIASSVVATHRIWRTYCAVVLQLIAAICNTSRHLEGAVAQQDDRCHL